MRETYVSILRYGYNRLWDKWPVMIIPLILRFYRRNGYWPNVFRPRTFNEKVTWRMLFDRREIYARVQGKFECRDFVVERTGRPDLLVPLVAMVTDPEDFLTIPLPERYMLKINDGSMLRKPMNRADMAARIELRDTARQWLAGNHAKYHHEWAYTKVRHAVIVEAFVGNADLVKPNGLKLNCFDGKVKFIHFNDYTDTRPYNDNYDSEWNYQPYLADPASHQFGPIPRPAYLDEAIALAEVISEGFDYLRVDFHIVDGHPKLGELTTLHSSGCCPLGGFERDLEFGSYWRLPKSVGPISALFGRQTWVEPSPRRTVQSPQS